MLKKSNPSKKDPAAQDNMLKHLLARAKQSAEDLLSTMANPVSLQHPEHIGDQLRARVLEGLLKHQGGPDQCSVVVIDLAQISGEPSERKRSSGSSSSGEKKKRKL